MTPIRSSRAATAALVFAALLACRKKHKPPPPVSTTATPSARATATGKTGPANASDVAGNYNILSASNPGGKGGYKGTVAITKRGDLYAVDWTIAHTPPYHGVGIVEGKILGVGWGLGTAYGVAVYKVDGGNLDGRWATSSSGSRAGIEKLSGPAGLNGTYRITEGTNAANGKPYTGTVSITPSGAVYDVTWHTPGAAYSGVGILRGKVFSVGWGTAGKGAGVVVYQLGSQLDGQWAQPHGTQLGTEVLGKQ